MIHVTRHVSCRMCFVGVGRWHDVLKKCQTGLAMVFLGMDLTEF